MTTCPRAILGKPIGCPAAKELPATMETSERTTGVTEDRAGVTGHEYLAAFSTDFGSAHNRQPSVASKFGMITAEFLLQNAVANGADSNEIR